jgi:hypothetical protein
MAPRPRLASYWEMDSVRRNLAREQYIETLDSEAIRKADSEGWRAFLRIYFDWKFRGNYLPQRLADLESNEPERLLRIRGLLFDSDFTNIRRTLERARYIKGLGPAGASGLLAVLFPTWFGTVDKFVVTALRQAPTLPERGRLAKMNPSSLTDDDAVLLVEIMRRKVLQLNALFRTKEWTPRKIDKILWTLGHDDRCQ